MNLLVIIDDYLKKNADSQDCDGQMGLTRKKIIQQIPKFSLPSLARVYTSKKPLKPANNRRCVEGLNWSSSLRDINSNIAKLRPIIDTMGHVTTNQEKLYENIENR